ncbi:hypothetical protein L9F63_002745, partial [Diploptera punctata]
KSGRQRVSSTSGRDDNALRYQKSRRPRRLRVSSTGVHEFSITMRVLGHNACSVSEVTRRTEYQGTRFRDGYTFRVATTHSRRNDDA